MDDRERGREGGVKEEMENTSFKKALECFLSFFTTKGSGWGSSDQRIMPMDFTNIKLLHDVFISFKPFRS